MAPVPVLVLGMHRSGTSVATQVVASLGLEVGDEDLLMGPAPSNQGGHWEVTHLTELNDDLLRELGGRWSAPPAVPPERLAALAADTWGERACDALEHSFATGDWVWKDPRLCLLLPFWRPVIADDALTAIVVLREPAEVARSLEERNDIGLAYGIALWERHLRAVLEGARGLRTLVVRYADLVAEPIATAAQIAGFLGRPVPDGSAVAAVVYPAHRHQEAEGTEPLSPEAEALRALVEGLAGVHEQLDVDLPPETPNLQLAFDEHARMSRWEDLAHQYRPLVDEAVVGRARIAELEGETAALRGRLDRFERFPPIRAGLAVRRAVMRRRGG